MLLRLVLADLNQKTLFKSRFLFFKQIASLSYALNQLFLLLRDESKFEEMLLEFSCVPMAKLASGRVSNEKNEVICLV